MLSSKIYAMGSLFISHTLLTSLDLQYVLTEQSSRASVVLLRDRSIPDIMSRRTSYWLHHVGVMSDAWR